MASRGCSVGKLTANPALFRYVLIVTAKKFYDWQTAGGTNDVMHLVDCLERAEVRWCAISGIAVNHWAEEPMVTRDVDFVVAAEDVDRAVSTLAGEGFTLDRFQ